MFTIRTQRASSSMADPAAALRVAMDAMREGRKPTLHQFGGRHLSLAELSAIAGMSALIGRPTQIKDGNVTAAMFESATQTVS